MTNRDRARSRYRARAIAAFGTLGVLTVAAVVVLVTVGATAGLPQAWWPRIGSAFAPSPSPTASTDPSPPSTSAAHDSCTHSPADTHSNGTGRRDVLRLALTATALILLYAVCAGGRGRR
ncbi:hypothetical protein ACFYZ9_38400 [Streptomyces sp. NPDC001691]|uniref:hypothetical protein n=1 Tax=Streptomyces sp. NPDC001691 TaxID=3364600 RepID=UPI0036BCD0A0